MIGSKTIVVATHRRSGTHWTIDALRNNSPDISPQFLTLEQTALDHHQPMTLDDFQRNLFLLNGHVLIKVHDLPSATFWRDYDRREFAKRILRDSPTVYVHRDGRDVMVSLYHYVQSFNEQVANMSFPEFLRMPNELDGKTTLSRPAFWAHHIQIWTAQPNLIPVSYQSLETDYEQTVKDIAAFLGVKLNPSIQPINIRKNKKPSLTQRIQYRLGLNRQKVSSAVQPRKGKSGDWQNYFSEDDLQFFMDEAGEVTRELGYID